MHAERTADPRVLRWVLHSDLLSGCLAGRRRVPEHAPLHSLIADGSITEVALRNGNLLVTTEHPQHWRQIAPQVQSALNLELDELESASGHWLLNPEGSAGHGTPTAAEVQAVLDRAAGGLFTDHGGSMRVTSVDATSVTLRSEGACRGCSRSADTVLTTIGPAIRAAFPEIVEMTMERPDADTEGIAATSRTSPVRLFRRRRTTDASA